MRFYHKPGEKTHTTHFQFCFFFRSISNPMYCFIWISDEVRRQMNALREAKKVALDATEIDKVIATQFHMKCDYCDVIFKSLQEAQYHYMHEHQIADGYIQCCGIKFKKTINIEGHVLWHLKPDLFK